ncbi:hypothetical protein KCP75_02510 [Salmonella enterica subsp. enterica]|nr:hypothetical protein KCP75_02510 [Salmonella enterica subsp. enterica]
MSPAVRTRAIKHFRKGYLIALRELRYADSRSRTIRCAPRRAHPRRKYGIPAMRFYCIGHNTGSEKLVRTAARSAFPARQRRLARRLASKRQR